MSKNYYTAKIVDLTIDKSNSSKEELDHPIDNYDQNKTLAIYNNVSNPQASNSKIQIAEQESMINQNSIVNITRITYSTKSRKLTDGRLAGPKKIRKAKNIIDKYTINRSTNKYILGIYSKIKNSLSKEDKKLFSQRVKNWFQIEMNKLTNQDDFDTMPISKLMKQAPIIQTNYRYIEPTNSVRIFDFHFVLDSTCLETDEKHMLPKQTPWSCTKYVKAVDKMIIDKKENFYRVFLREYNTVEGKLEYCQNEIEFLKKWLLNLSHSKAKDFHDLLSEMTSARNFEELTKLLENSKGKRIDIKKLNSDTLKHIRSKPTVYFTYTVSPFGQGLSLPTCSEFGLNKKFCKIVELEYYEGNTRGLLRPFDFFVVLDQFDFYSECFNICKQNKDKFKEKGVQDPDMIIDSEIAYIVTSNDKKLDTKVKVFSEKYAENGFLQEKYYCVLCDFSSSMPVEALDIYRKIHESRLH